MHDQEEVANCVGKFESGFGFFIHLQTINQSSKSKHSDSFQDGNDFKALKSWNQTVGDRGKQINQESSS